MKTFYKKYVRSGITQHNAISAGLEVNFKFSTLYLVVAEICESDIFDSYFFHFRDALTFFMKY